MRVLFLFLSLCCFGCIANPTRVRPPHLAALAPLPKPVVREPMPARASLRIGSSVGWSKGAAHGAVHSAQLGGFVIALKKNVRVIDEQTYAQRVLLRVDKPIYKLALSGDGRRGVVAHRDELVVWSTTTGQIERRIPETLPGALHLSSDGRLLTLYRYGRQQVDAGRPRTVGELTRWDLETGTSRTLPLATPSIVLHRPVFSDDGSVVAGLHRGSVAVINVATGSAHLPSALRRARAVAVAARGGFVYAMTRTRIYVEPIDHRQLRSSFATSSSSLSLHVSPDGRYLASYDWKTRQVFLHDTRTQTRRSFPGGSTLTFSSDSTQLFTRVGERAVVRAVPAGTTRSPGLAMDTLGSLIPARDGQILFGLSLTGELRAWSASTGASLRGLKLRYWGHPPVSRHGTFLALLRPDYIDLVRVATGGERVLRIQSGKARAAGFSVDETRFAYTNKDGIHVIDIATGKPLQTIPYTLDPRNGQYRSSLVEPMDPEAKRHLAIGGGLMLELETARHRDLLDLLRTRRFVPAAVSADGRRLLATHHSGPLFVVDLPTGKRWGVELERRAPVTMSPNGRVLAFKNGPTITLWDVEKQRPYDVLRGHRSEVQALAFFADGKRLASASRDTTILVWTVNTTR